MASAGAPALPLEAARHGLGPRRRPSWRRGDGGDDRAPRPRPGRDPPPFDAHAPRLRALDDRALASEARAARAALRTRADWPAADIAHALATDPASPDSPVLTGAPLDFRQPVSVLFSTPVPFVGVRAGYPDAAGQWTVTAYDAVGTSLGSVVSSTVGSRISAFSTRTAPRSPG